MEVTMQVQVKMKETHGREGGRQRKKRKRDVEGRWSTNGGRRGCREAVGPPRFVMEGLHLNKGSEVEPLHLHRRGRWDRGLARWRSDRANGVEVRWKSQRANEGLHLSPLSPFLSLSFGEPPS